VPLDQPHELAHVLAARHSLARHRVGAHRHHLPPAVEAQFHGRPRPLLLLPTRSGLRSGLLRRDAPIPLTLLPETEVLLGLAGRDGRVLRNGREGLRLAQRQRRQQLRPRAPRQTVRVDQRAPAAGAHWRGCGGVYEAQPRLAQVEQQLGEAAALGAAVGGEGGAVARTELVLVQQLAPPPPGLRRRRRRRRRCPVLRCLLLLVDAL
jgi:hypothetical protein